jgi:hypothetical protein
MKDKEHIHKHMDILQGIISRMANNSSNCKNYCITLVSALLALDIIKTDVSLFKIAYLPIIAFCFLDCYYLYLERVFRTQFNSFVAKWHEGKLEEKDLFIFKAPGNTQNAVIETVKEFFSFSILPFYGLLSALICILMNFVK